LVRQVKNKKLQGLVITEHHYLWTSEEIDSLKKEAGLESHFLVFAGQEIETDFGHVLVYGADKTIEKRIKLAELRKRFPEAALVLAHPFRNGSTPDRDKLLDSSLDAVEIFSSNHQIQENCRGLNFWHDYKFTAIAGSDSHAVETCGLYPTQIIHPVGTIGELAAEIKAGRCLPFVKEIPKAGSNILINEVIIGTKGDDESRDRIIIKKISDRKRFDREKERDHVVERLFETDFHGSKFRVPRIIYIDPDNQEIIEESQRGKTLADLLARVSPAVGRGYIELAGRWLAKMHAIKPETTDTEPSFARERRRFQSYLESFRAMPALYEDCLKDFVDFVRMREEAYFVPGKAVFVHNHGDYHPKNIIIGQDISQDASTVFISVIDFNSMILMPRAFDVGYFLAQFQSQLGELYKENVNDYFLGAYRDEGKLKDAGFRADVEFFRLRANLSIGSYLVKVSAGDSPQMKRIIADFREAMRPMQHGYSARGNH
jgi:tRNA A-37 threonylcarbamoyl transferase component Bud32